MLPVVDASTGPVARVASAPLPAGTSLYETMGRIEALSPDSVTLSHDPVPAIGWPAMTMGFRLADPNLAQGLKVGDQVMFAFERQGNTQILRRIMKTGASP